jgi:NADH-quinone oxidoreductase E subunit
MAACKCGCGCKEQDNRYVELYELIDRYKEKKGVLIPVLHGAQKIFGYLSEDVLHRIARALSIPFAEVYGVATFYSFFNLNPKGKHIIGVCLGTACYVRGAQEVVEELKKELNIDVNETTKDGNFTLSITRCVGACGLAPVMTIDKDVYGRMTPKKVKEILSKYQENDA